VQMPLQLEPPVTSRRGRPRSMMTRPR
jgi:hypothetical protein